MSKLDMYEVPGSRLRELRDAAARVHRLEADLAALREAAQAVDETSNHIVLTGRSAESVAAAQLALQNLRAVLASADSESREETP